MRNFQILIASVLKSDKQRLHTASASDGQTHYRGMAPCTTAGLAFFRHPQLQVYNPQMKISGDAKEWTWSRAIFLSLLSQQSPSLARYDSLCSARNENSVPANVVLYGTKTVFSATCENACRAYAVIGYSHRRRGQDKTVLCCPRRRCEHNCRQDKTVLSCLDPVSMSFVSFRPNFQFPNFQ